MLNDVHTRVTEGIGFAEHFGRLSPFSLPDKTLGSEVATHDAHVYETRYTFLLFCGDVDHSSRTDGELKSKDGLAGLALHIERDRWGLRGERAGEKTFCTGVAMCHEIRLGKPERVVRIVCACTRGR